MTEERLPMLYSRNEIPSYLLPYADKEGRIQAPPDVFETACLTCSPHNPGFSSDAAWFRVETKR